MVLLGWGGEACVRVCARPRPPTLPTPTQPPRPPPAPLPLPPPHTHAQVLPLGASKGVGVAWLLERLGVDPGDVMALGDAENDLEMLQLCGLVRGVWGEAAAVRAGEGGVGGGCGCVRR